LTESKNFEEGWLCRVAQEIKPYPEMISARCRTRLGGPSGSQDTTIFDVGSAYWGWVLAIFGPLDRPALGFSLLIANSQGGYCGCFAFFGQSDFLSSLL